MKRSYNYLIFFIILFSHLLSSFIFPAPAQAYTAYTFEIHGKGFAGINPDGSPNCSPGSVDYPITITAQSFSFASQKYPVEGPYSSCNADRFFIDFKLHPEYAYARGTGTYKVVGQPDGDFDSDGLPNSQDLDDDGDGIPDSSDPTPGQFSTDTDGDGIPNETDTDDDGDGIPDSEDPAPLVPLDTDGDGIPDKIDTDDDGDGIPDSEDPAPLVPLDTDGDGIPDKTDTDDDGDGVPDSEDSAPQDSSNSSIVCEAIYNDQKLENKGFSLSQVASALVQILPSSPNNVRLPTIISNMSGDGSLGANLAIELYSAVWQYLAIIAFVKFYKLLPGKST